MTRKLAQARYATAALIAAAVLAGGCGDDDRGTDTTSRSSGSAGSASPTFEKGDEFGFAYGERGPDFRGRALHPHQRR